MSRTIWKYPVGAGAWSVEMPRHSDVLTVQTQGGRPQMWVLVDPNAPKETRWFITVGTGHTLPDDADWSYGYIGTFQVEWMVFHVFATAEPHA